MEKLLVVFCQAAFWPSVITVWFWFYFDASLTLLLFNRNVLGLVTEIQVTTVVVFKDHYLD